MEDRGCVEVVSPELPCATVVLLNRYDGVDVVDSVFSCLGPRHYRKGVDDGDLDVCDGFWIWNGNCVGCSIVSVR